MNEEWNMRKFMKQKEKEVGDGFDAKDFIDEFHTDLRKKQVRWIEKLQDPIPDVLQYENRGNIPVLITSSSRFLPLKVQMLSFIDKAKLNGNFIFYLNEDVIQERTVESNSLVQWAKKSNIFKKIFVNNPNEGRGSALNRMRKFAEGYKYIFYLEDDWEFLRYINVNSILNLMDKHEDINQIGFHNRHQKRIFTSYQFHYNYKDYNIDGHDLILSERWGFSPSIWRTSFILPHWEFPSKYAGKWIQNKFKSNYENQTKEINFETYQDFLKKSLGAYYYGKLGGNMFEYAPTYHLCPDIRNDRCFL